MKIHNLAAFCVAAASAVLLGAVDSARIDEWFVRIRFRNFQRFQSFNACATPASTDTWLGLSCDSTPAEYFQAPIPSRKVRFLKPAIGRLSRCNCGQVGVKSRVKSLSPSISEEK